MKTRAATSPKSTAKKVRAAVAAAPESVTDPDAPYDPNDPKAVAAFWKGAVITKAGGAAAALLRLRQQSELKRLRGKIAWDGDLDAMRRDK